MRLAVCLHRYFVPAHRPWSKLWRSVLLRQGHPEICPTANEQGRWRKRRIVLSTALHFALFKKIWQEGPVSQVKFSPDGSWLAVVTGGGHVALWEYSVHKAPPWERCHASTLLKDAVVKALQWDGKGARLFYGDDQGRVALIPLPKVKRTSCHAHASLNS